MLKHSQKCFANVLQHFCLPLAAARRLTLRELWWCQLTPCLQSFLQLQTLCIYIWLLRALPPDPHRETSVLQTPCAHPDFRAWYATACITCNHEVDILISSKGNICYTHTMWAVGRKKGATYELWQMHIDFNNPFTFSFWDKLQKRLW